MLNHITIIQISTVYPKRIAPCSYQEPLHICQLLVDVPALPWTAWGCFMSTGCVGFELRISSWAYHLWFHARFWLDTVCRGLSGFPNFKWGRFGIHGISAYSLDKNEVSASLSLSLYQRQCLWFMVTMQYSSQHSTSSSLDWGWCYFAQPGVGLSFQWILSLVPLGTSSMQENCIIYWGHEHKGTGLLRHSSRLTVLRAGADFLYYWSLHVY